MSATDRTWYTAACLECDSDPRVFDRKRERDEWAATHVGTTGHTVRVARTNTPPTYRPKVNCCICIQFGTQSPAAAEVYESAVCADHVSVMQLAGTLHNQQPGMVFNRAAALGLARNILTWTKPIGKQED